MCCNLLITVELATNLNAAEGFLIQARNGTDDSSEIIGTFLDPSVVRMRDSVVPLNYKILSCNRSIFDMDPLPVSGSYIRCNCNLSNVPRPSWLQRL